MCGYFGPAIFFETEGSIPQKNPGKAHIHTSISGSGATRPLGGMGPKRWATSPRYGPEVKMKEVVPTMARRRGSDAGQSRRR